MPPGIFILVKASNIFQQTQIIIIIRRYIVIMFSVALDHGYINSNIS